MAGNLNFWKQQQIGTLLYRRIEKVSFMCLITLNIWVNVVTGYLLSQAKWAVEGADQVSNSSWMNKTINKLFDTTAYTRLWMDIITVFSIISTLLSIILWYQIIKGLLFMIGDYKITLEERGTKRIWPFVLVTVVNIIVFFILKSIWWPEYEYPKKY